MNDKMNVLLEQYVGIVDFLGKIMGPNYEIALHDLTGNRNAIAAIANNHVSGRTVGAPLTDKALQFIADRVYERSDYQLNYPGVARDGSKTRSSTKFIKDAGGKLIGMLCINCNLSDYYAVVGRLEELFGLPGAPKQPEAVAEPARHGGELAENFAESVPYLVEMALGQVLQDPTIPIERMTQNEKLQIVDALNKKGVFLLKGAVSEVATALCSSEASIYRYLSTVNKQQRK